MLVKLNLSTISQLFSNKKNKPLITQGFLNCSSFVDEPAKLRKALYLYLTALCEDYMGNTEKAKENLKESVALNNDYMLAIFFNHFP
mgnify:CR=1 FL=1